MGQPYSIQERTFQFALRIVTFSKSLIERGPIARKLALQVLSAGTSIGANLEEARAGQTKPDFIAKCSISRKEAFEVRFWLRLVAAAECDLRPQAVPLIEEATEITKILTVIVRNAATSPTRGTR
jgi:four helix bundle protein